jgi:hypothetical protein
MKAWVNILNSLDKSFESKSSNEKNMIFAMIFISIGYLAYALFLPYAQERYEQSVRQKETLQRAIVTNKEYLKSITFNGDREFYVKKYNSEIEELEEKINTTNENIGFIVSKLEDLSTLLFNKESWSKFLDSITHKAKAQQVNLKYIENNYVDNNGSFGHVLQISLGCDGQYKNIVKFMNQLEKSVLVTDIYGSHLYLENNDTVVAADINISVWGINH